MGYRELIDWNIGTVYQTGIATKILQHMDRIRNESDISQSRRWIMELLQNSRDVAYEEQAVRVRVVLLEDTVTFSHSGKPFRVKDILSIINQVSSKSPEDTSVGQFGTGFMTTYQLSETVDIQGLIKDGELPCKPFSVRLDRRGTTKEEILDEIFKTMEQLKKVDEAEEKEDFSPEAFNTGFIYHLDSQESRTAARRGLEDLQETILYVLLFSEKIASVELVFGSGENSRTVRFQRGPQEDAGGGLKRLSVEKIAEEGGERAASVQTAVWLSEGDLTVAAGWDGEGFVPVSPKLPRLFVDFPLIGTENFPFPVVVNCRSFRVNESRSGITLVDNETSRDAVVNKELMERGVRLYGGFLRSALEAGYRRMDHIVAVPGWTPSRELSEEWVKRHLYQRLLDIVSGEEMIRTGAGTVNFRHEELYLLRGESREETEDLRRLVQVLRHIRVPEGEEDWSLAFAGYEVSESKSLSIETVAARAGAYLADSLEEDKMEALEWCQALYRAAMKNRELAVRIRAGELNLFPNQDPEDWRQRRLFHIHEIRRDPQIPCILKEVSDVLDQLEPQKGEEPLRLRKNLLHSGFDDMGLKELEDYDRVRLYNHILRRSSRKYGAANGSLRQSQYEHVWRKAWQLLLSCGEDRELYELSRAAYREVYGEELPPRNVADDEFYDGMWRNAFSNAARQILEAIEGSRDMETLCREMLAGKSRKEAYGWLNRVYQKAFWYMGQSNLRRACAFPNQKGSFRALEDLREDRTQGEQLKRIAGQFADQEGACDVYEYMLDRNITLKDVSLPSVGDEEVAMRINRVVQGILSSRNLSDAKPEHQEACTALLGWIQENPQLAKRYFPGFAKEEEQMRLLTPKAAVRIQRKAMECQSILEKLGASTAEEAMEKLSALKEQAEKERNWERDREGGMSAGRRTAWEDMVWDQAMEAEFGALPEEGRRDICREIGIGGEKFALGKVAEYFLGQNYVKVRESGEELLLLGERDEKSQVRIFYPDSRVYHQAGWDIRVTVTSEGKREEYYLEVKTHTAGSVRRREVYLSNEQMKAAVKNRGRYVVLGVVYNYRQRRGEKMTAIPDPVNCIADGTMVNQQKGYVFLIGE